MHFEIPPHSPQPGALKITIVEKRADGTCRVSVYTTPLAAPDDGPDDDETLSGPAPEERLVALAS